MERNKQPSKVELLELDLDTRLTDLWAEAAYIREWNLEVLGVFMRAAYGKGYSDAIKEPVAEKGKLMHDHGYNVPTPRPSPPDPDVSKL